MSENPRRTERSIVNGFYLFVFSSIPIAIYIMITYAFFGSVNINIWLVLIIITMDLSLVIVMIRFAIHSNHIFLPFLFYILSTVLMVGVFAHIYYAEQSLIFEGQGDYTFFESVYFSVITWTSLGYGDVLPLDHARPWIILEVVYGYVHMGLFMGFILSFLTRRQG